MIATAVDAGIFHALHTTWIGILQTTLNEGVLPPNYYALAEQDAADVVPDVLTLHATGHKKRGGGKPRASGQAVAELEPVGHQEIDRGVQAHSLEGQHLGLSTECMIVRHADHVFWQIAASLGLLKPESLKNISSMMRPRLLPDELPRAAE